MAKFTIDPKAVRELQSADVFIFDVDDTVYNKDCGLHEAIKQNICDHANGMASQDAGWCKLIEDGYASGLLVAPEARTKGLDKFFPFICRKIYQDTGLEGLAAYLSQAYANIDYSAIDSDPILVQAIRDLRATGRRVALYSNGPASGNPAKPLHIEHVLAQLGFAPGEFSAKDIFDLKRAVPLGRGKPTVESVHDMLEGLNVEPGRTVAFFDDVPANLAPFKDPGILARNPTVTVLCQPFGHEANQPKFLEGLDPEYVKFVDAVCGHLGEVLRLVTANSSTGLTLQGCLSTKVNSHPLSKGNT